MAKIIGLINTAFTPKDSAKPIEGITIHITEPVDPKRGVGESTDRFFLSKSKAAELSVKPEIGLEVEILYNRFGKVSDLRLVSNFEVD